MKSGGLLARLYYRIYDNVREDTGNEIVKVAYRQSRGGNREIKPNHVGTGISYVANVIISALSCRKDSLFVIENPEIHLHPKAQSKLLDFFCFLAARGLQVIIETHSDHIFNGLRKNIKMGRISERDSNIYFFRQDENLISIRVKYPSARMEWFEIMKRII